MCCVWGKNAVRSKIPAAKQSPLQASSRPTSLCASTGVRSRAALMHHYRASESTAVFLIHCGSTVPVCIGPHWTELTELHRIHCTELTGAALLRRHNRWRRTVIIRTASSMLLLWFRQEAAFRCTLCVHFGICRKSFPNDSRQFQLESSSSIRANHVTSPHAPSSYFGDVSIVEAPYCVSAVVAANWWTN